MAKKIADQVSEIKPILASLGNPDGLLSGWRSSFGLGKVACAGRRSKSKPGYLHEVLFMLSLLRILASSYSIKSYFSKVLTASPDYSQAAFYRDMADPKADWRRQLYCLNSQIAEACDKAAAYDDRRGLARTTALVVDDTISRHCGQDMEGSSQVHDHTDNSRPRGYKLLVLGLYNGSNMRALDFAAVRESVKPTPYRNEKDIKCPAMSRKRELDRSKIDLAADMLERASRNGINPDFVLWDSWFTTPALVAAVQKAWSGKTHFLGMMKMDRRRKLSYNGRQTNLGELQKTLKRTGRVHQSRRFGTYHMSVEVEIEGIGRIKLFFSRMGRRGPWKALATSDLSMDYAKAMETYAIRWGVEVLFRECKTLLGLDKCQCRQFNSQIAHWTMVFQAHALLAAERHARDCRSLGELFLNTREGFQQQALAERLVGILEQIIAKVADQLGGADNVTLGALMKSGAYQEFKELLQLSSLQSSVLLLSA